VELFREVLAMSRPQQKASYEKNRNRIERKEERKYVKIGIEE